MNQKLRSLSYGILSVLGIGLMFLIAEYSTLAALIPLGIAWISLIITIQAFDKYYYGENIWARNSTEKKELVFITVVICLILDLFGMIFTRLWYYPPGTIALYLAIAPIFYFLYGKLLYLIYESIEHYFKKEKHQNISKKVYSNLINLELVIGVVLTVVTLIYSYKYFQKIEENIFEIGEAGGFMVEWWYIAAPLLATFFIVEYLCYRANKPTLTLNILQKNFYPLISIIIASIAAIILTEIVNAPFQIWTFSEQAWPYSDISLFKIPAIAYLLWPLQFPPMIALFRYLYTDEREIW